MSTNTSQHQDLLGQPINVGDCVAVAHGHFLFVAQVIKLNPKMVKVQRLGRGRVWSINKYPNEMIVLDPQDVTFYLLKKGV